jgi:hypothetical protein
MTQMRKHTHFFSRIYLFLMDPEEVGVVSFSNTHHVGIIGCISPNYTDLLSLPSVELFGICITSQKAVPSQGATESF